ncbi:MAG: hypothetical protein AB8B69_05460 [Chitinophagales bacterium]
MNKIISQVLSILLLLTFTTCQKEGFEEQYIEGTQIPNTSTVYEHHVPSSHGFLPKISPNSLYIAHEGNEEAGRGIYIYEFATQEKYLLVEGGTSPDWSPNSENLVFSFGGNIYKVHIGSKVVQQLTNIGNSYSPDWSPDGTKIAYRHSIDNEQGPAGTWTVESDGSNNQPLILLSSPDWESPEKLWGSLSQEEFKLYSLKTEMVEREFSVPLKDESLANNSRIPKISPDGQKIVYSNDEGVWVINSDGSNQKRILPNHFNGHNTSFDSYQNIQLYTGQPSWHPDGKRIVYVHGRVLANYPPNDFTSTTTDIEISFYLLDVEKAILRSNL